MYKHLASDVSLLAEFTLLECGSGWRDHFNASWPTQQTLCRVTNRYHAMGIFSNEN